MSRAPGDVTLPRLSASDAPNPVVPPRPPRILVVDWLRGVAVITMVLAHSYDAWMNPALRSGPAYAVVRHLSGIPSRLFLFLVGVSAAIVIESYLSRGKTAREMRWRLFSRGLAVLVLAYVFRLQEHILAGFWGGWSQVFRVDILNCIGASMMLLSVVAVPRGNRPRYAACLALAAVFVGFGPIVGPAVFPSWLPPELTSYIGGQRPMCWFPLFPWGAWSLLGVVVGHLWLRHGRDQQGQRRLFVGGLVLGVLLIGTVLVVRAINPEIIRYPSDVVQQMGPGSFFFRLGIIGIASFLGWLHTRNDKGGFSIIRQLGQTSLLIYWVHVEICYGFGARPIQKQLSFGQATLAFLILLAAMLGLSLLRTRYSDRVMQWFRRRRAPRASSINGPS